MVPDISPTCPRCGGQVERTHEQCPHCGFLIISYIISSSPEDAHREVEHLRGAARSEWMRTHQRPPAISLPPDAGVSEIGRCYECAGGVGGALGFPTSDVEAVPASPRGTTGYVQHFEHGDIYWSPRFGAHAISGAIVGYHRANGSTSGAVGYPASDELDAPNWSQSHSTGTRHLMVASGRCQRFEGLTDYSEEVRALLGDLTCGATVYWSQEHGARMMSGPIGERYEQMHGTTGILGFPTSDEEEAGQSPAGTRGRYQEFERGVICYSDEFGTYAVLHELGEVGWVEHREDGMRLLMEARNVPVGKYFLTAGGTRSRLGFPVSQRRRITCDGDSLYQAVYCQYFEGPRLYDHEVQLRLGEVRCGAAIYTTQTKGYGSQYGHPITRAASVLEDIGEYYERIGGPLSFLGCPERDEHHVTSGRGTAGKVQQFARGMVFWSSRFGTCFMSLSIYECFAQFQGIDGRPGFPVTSEFDAAQSAYGTAGKCQRFEATWDYPEEICKRMGAPPCGASIYYTESHGAYPVWGGIGQYYEECDGTAGTFGFPMAEERAVGPSPQGTEGYCQLFEGGAIYWCKEHGSCAIVGDILAYHDRVGGIQSALGWPLADSLEAAASPHGTTGYCQRFEGREEYAQDLKPVAGMQDRRWGCTVYSSEIQSTHATFGPVGECYERLGGTASPLGFPVSDLEEVKSTRGGAGYRQRFEHGSILWSEQVGARVVFGA